MRYGSASVRTRTNRSCHAMSKQALVFFSASFVVLGQRITIGLPTFIFIVSALRRGECGWRGMLVGGERG